MPSNASLAGRLTKTIRTHLVLGRVSNLPTVWSNCLAAWILAGGAATPTLAILLLAFSLIYLGGMYLNDAFDADWDRQFKNDRPIVRGDVLRPTVFIFGAAFIVGGLALLFTEGRYALAFGAGLSSLVILYTVLHKKISWSPLIVAACRFSLYPAVAVASTAGLNGRLMAWAGALAAYVIGLSYVAKVEEQSVLKRYMPLTLLFIPPAINLYGGASPTKIALSAAFLAWLLYAFSFIFIPRRANFRRAVGAMLAGICLVDLLAVSQTRDPLIWQAACIGLFAMAWLFQRTIPAT